METEDPFCQCGYRKSLHTPTHPIPDSNLGPDFKRSNFFNLDVTPELEKYLNSQPLKKVDR